MGISSKKEKFQSDTILRNFTSKKDIAKDDIILKELENNSELNKKLNEGNYVSIV